MPDFSCTVCGESFSLSQEVLDRYPGWRPRFCKEHGKPKTGRGGGRGRRDRRGGRREENLALADVLDKYTGGPQDGVFTDGSCMPNPGPGGWGVVHVVGGEVVVQRHGEAAATTNNRMELVALIEGMKLMPLDGVATVYTDSQLCVNTINDWAAGWERRGWKRKTGPIKNLDLVKDLYALAGERPGIELTWIAAHSGYRWNEYADSLASAWMRDEL